MNWTEILQAGLIILGVSAALAVLIGNIYYVVRSKNGKIQKEQLDQLTVDFNNCEGQHKENLKLIHQLQGQIDTLKEIPLKEIKVSLEKIADTNSQILEATKKR